MEIIAIMLSEKDNVAVLTQDARIGDVVKCSGGTGESVDCTVAVPIWHKVALRDIKKGELVYKYGEVIGEAMTDIPKGAWVSHENIFSVPRDYANEYVK